MRSSRFCSDLDLRNFLDDRTIWCATSNSCGLGCLLVVSVNLLDFLYSESLFVILENVLAIIAAASSSCAVLHTRL